jgi:hypothetical protein
VKIGLESGNTSRRETLTSRSTELGNLFKSTLKKKSTGAKAVFAVNDGRYSLKARITTPKPSGESKPEGFLLSDLFPQGSTDGNQPLYIAVRYFCSNHLTSGAGLGSGLGKTGGRFTGGGVDCGIIDGGSIEAGFFESGIFDSGRADAGRLDCGIVLGGICTGGLTAVEPTEGGDCVGIGG